MKFVYVLTGPDNSIYYKMTRLSLATLKYSNRDGEVIIATDPVSYQGFLDGNCLVMSEADKFLIIDTPEGTASYKSRFIKTRLGLEIEGPFLYIDSDVLVRKQINISLSPHQSVAAAANHSRELFNEQVWEEDLCLVNKMGWEISDQRYFNGGIIFFSGSSESVYFSELWHAHWKESNTVTGAIQDQPSLNHILWKYNINIKRLPNSLNAQIKTRFYFSDHEKNTSEPYDWDAAIWHFLVSGKDELITTEFEKVISRMSAGDILKASLIKSLVDPKHPWRRFSFIDDLVAKKITSLPRIKGPYQLWVEGKRFKAVRQWVAKLF